MELTPFVATHARRKDGLPAMLMALDSDHALYRVRIQTRRHTTERVLRTTAGRFNSTFGER